MIPTLLANFKILQDTWNHPLKNYEFTCMVAEKATLQLLIARSLFAFRISYSRGLEASSFYYKCKSSIGGEMYISSY